MLSIKSIKIKNFKNISDRFLELDQLHEFGFLEKTRSEKRPFRRLWSSPARAAREMLKK